MYCTTLAWVHVGGGHVDTPYVIKLAQALALQSR